MFVYVWCILGIFWADFMSSKQVEIWPTHMFFTIWMFHWMTINSRSGFNMMDEKLLKCCDMFSQQQKMKIVFGPRMSIHDSMKAVRGRATPLIATNIERLNKTSIQRNHLKSWNNNILPLYYTSHIKTILLMLWLSNIKSVEIEMLFKCFNGRFIKKSWCQSWQTMWRRLACWLEMFWGTEGTTALTYSSKRIRYEIKFIQLTN